jgi:hypothetical protein
VIIPAVRRWNMAAVRVTPNPGIPKRSWLARLRRAWVITGATAGAVFIGWSLSAHRASGEARAALDGTPVVAVSDHNGFWRFQPKRPASVGLLFFPGALVDPAAHAPLARAVAERGYSVLLVRVPRRGAFGGAEGNELSLRCLRALRESGHGWVESSRRQATQAHREDAIFVPAGSVGGASTHSRVPRAPGSCQAGASAAVQRGRGRMRNPSRKASSAPRPGSRITADS